MSNSNGINALSGFVDKMGVKIDTNTLTNMAKNMENAVPRQPTAAIETQSPLEEQSQNKGPTPIETQSPPKKILVITDEKEIKRALEGGSKKRKTRSNKKSKKTNKKRKSKGKKASRRRK